MRHSAIAALLFGCATLSAAQSGANWSYEGKTGPIVWGRLDPAYQACSKGHEQSPLDIRSTHPDKSLQPLEFHYVAGPMTLENTGRGIIARVDPGSDLVANGIRYHLVELDFHHPSEHSRQGQARRHGGGSRSPQRRRQGGDCGRAPEPGPRISQRSAIDPVGASAQAARHQRQSD